ncbi:HAMP domain-containing sensor histidine kinase [Paenibacillus sp. GbtcB18]|uniref:sensor histidine kinase n=1 Tax=Paenibacillus sp. GbtcB18 TaxID=2824763 RepID=UPI001C2F17F3|nr:HAMP domain-containing sensor histidine kinase [Paenibacillus sp. GbtcB18]
MKIRAKLMLSMGILIAFILFSLFAVTHIQFYIIRDLEYMREKPAFTALKENFQRQYAAGGNSWAGVRAEEMDDSSFFPEIALVSEGSQVVHKGQLPLRTLQDEGFPLFLTGAEGKKIGTLFVMDAKQYKTYEFKSMWYGIFPVVVRVSLLFTFVAALVISFFLSRRFTSPIRKLLQGIDSIKKGSGGDVKLPVARKDEFGAIARALQEMNDSLASLERSRKQMLSDVAHELKTPLMIMQGELELAQEIDEPLKQEKVSSLLDEVLRLNRLVHDVLELSRMEAGRAELRREPENIGALLQGLIEKTRYIAEDKNIHVRLRTPEEEIYAPVEKHRVLQALYNILINALHYTPAGGTVKIGAGTAVREGRLVVLLTVEDNGSGIAPEDLPHIFNRFYRADHSRTRPSGGTGLGLAIAEQNILLHGGSIGVQSEPGKGTVFTVLLPV